MRLQVLEQKARLAKDPAKCEALIAELTQLYLEALGDERGAEQAVKRIRDARG
jgi:hypothetical protein